MFVSSFGDNILYTVEALKKQYSGSIVILKDSNCRYTYEEDHQTSVLPFDLKSPYAFILSIYHLATCEKVFVDNYFGFLAAVDFRDNVECIQLWHASGAVKRFGLKDPSIETRKNRANERFRNVYHKFDHVVVGSDKMADIFKESFGLSDAQILRTGVPRTDYFFEYRDSANIREKMENKHPRIKGKKVILYAPTFRDNKLTDADVQLNLKLMYEALQDDYVLLMRLHPAVKTRFMNSYPNFIIDVSVGEQINELLMITDLLITDYSSIPYEFSLLNKPMIFYSYDLEDYSRARGFWEDYHSMVPGPVAYTSEEIIEIILNEPYNMGVVSSFARDWNEYSKGESSLQLIQAIYGEATEKEEVLAEQR
ncbi:CDP-glycerol glycerophosphotransferase family protein [Halobacillus amylolyticus]|uniref:CDP-glycerol glycerophosphotransferase family protein n=1 Tax=Halobacillus amylolyticus TaxID=2932259 RepID=A0ABY4HAF5_9BACI|nr:CDP-glycerol glycerophosphotransferase family protein [Halobacillus amylolyticus]UOR11642.1 CDP-glycerol glycerophosphotransferase family protein [Halobacillus amylolyticus]